MQKQLSFLPKIALEHGGEVRRGKRKITRPIDPKRPLHVVLRAPRARGKWSMLHARHRKKVEVLVQQSSRKFGVRVYRCANVGNHLHLLVQTRRRRDFQNFLRFLTGSIAFAITGTRKGRPIGRFWEKLAYSRIVSWGREFETVTTYFIKNLFEAAGFPEIRAPGAKVIRLRLRP